MRQSSIDLRALTFFLWTSTTSTPSVTLPSMSTSTCDAGSREPADMGQMQRASRTSTAATVAAATGRRLRRLIRAGSAPTTNAPERGGGSRSCQSASREEDEPSPWPSEDTDAALLDNATTTEEGRLMNALAVSRVSEITRSPDNAFSSIMSPTGERALSRARAHAEEPYGELSSSEDEDEDAALQI